MLERGGGAACPLVTETPPTPSALLKIREIVAQLGWGTPVPNSGSPTGPAPVIPSPLNPCSHCSNWLEAPLNAPCHGHP